MLIGIDASRAAIAQRTGTEAYSLHLLQSMLAHTDHRFRLYFNQPPVAGLLPAGPHIEQRVIPFPRLWTHLRLAAELARVRPDVLFVPSHVLPLIFPGRAAVTVHDLGYRLFPQAHRRFDRLYLELTTRWNARRASLIIADSQATRQDLVAHYGANSSRIRVIYPGYDSTLQPVRDPERLLQVRDRYNIRGEYLLTIGTLQPRKNLVRLIEAFTGLPDSAADDELQLVLAGRAGWLANPILQRAEQTGDRVILAGFVAEEDKAALLSGAVAFVFPSLYEGFGFPMLEAMACGTPVICSNTSSLPEVAGDAALQVDPLDTAALTAAMERLLADPALRETLVERGLANVQRFSWAKCAESVIAALEIIA